MDKSIYIISQCYRCPVTTGIDYLQLLWLLCHINDIWLLRRSCPDIQCFCVDNRHIICNLIGNLLRLFSGCEILRLHISFGITGFDLIPSVVLCFFYSRWSVIIQLGYYLTVLICFGTNIDIFLTLRKNKLPFFCISCANCARHIHGKTCCQDTWCNPKSLLMHTFPPSAYLISVQCPHRTMGSEQSQLHLNSRPHVQVTF